jgi:hypothetical protein
MTITLQQKKDSLTQSILALKQELQSMDYKLLEVENLESEIENFKTLLSTLDPELKQITLNELGVISPEIKPPEYAEIDLQEKPVFYSEKFSNDIEIKSFRNNGSFYETNDQGEEMLQENYFFVKIPKNVTKHFENWIISQKIDYHYFGYDTITKEQSLILDDYKYSSVGEIEKLLDSFIEYQETKFSQEAEALEILTPPDPLAKLAQLKKEDEKPLSPKPEIVFDMGKIAGPPPLEIFLEERGKLRVTITNNSCLEIKAKLKKDAQMVVDTVEIFVSLGTIQDLTKDGTEPLKYQGIYKISDIEIFDSKRKGILKSISQGLTSDVIINPMGLISADPDLFFDEDGLPKQQEKSENTIKIHNFEITQKGKLFTVCSYGSRTTKELSDWLKLNPLKEFFFELQDKILQFVNKIDGEGSIHDILNIIELFLQHNEQLDKIEENKILLEEKIKYPFFDDDHDIEINRFKQALNNELSRLGVDINNQVDGTQWRNYLYRNYKTTNIMIIDDDFLLTTLYDAVVSAKDKSEILVESLDF